jgi:dUTP pyrophosphatase
MSTINYLKNTFRSKDLNKRDGDAGYDLSSVQEYKILPGTRQLVNIGLNLEIPTNYYLQIFPRSSMACKGIDTSAGVIDSSYRGNVMVLLVNNSDRVFNVKIGDRVAQAVPIFIGHTDTLEVFSVSTTKRGVEGFGSTGV